MSNDATRAETIFVSYAREDHVFADWLARNLARRGLAVWTDREIGAGDRWDTSVQEAIRAARAMIVVLTPHSVRSSTVHDEFSLALDEEDLVVPVLVEACEIPFRLRQLQRIDFRTGRESALEVLVGRLQECGPTSVPQAITGRLRECRSQRVRLFARAVGLVSISIAAVVVRGGLSARAQRATESARAAVSAAPARAPSLQDAALGEQMLESYRTLTDARLRRLSVKSRWETAAESFEVAATRTEPGKLHRTLDAKAAFARGRLAVLTGALEPAEESFIAAANADPDWAPPHVELAGVYTRTGRFTDAHAQARLALAIDPEFWLAAIADGPVYAAEGRLDEAVSVYETALGKYDIPLVRGNLALAYHATCLHDERALALANEALGRDPDLQPALTVLAERALEKGAARAALATTQHLVDLELFDVSAWLLHGDVLLALGKHQLAKQALTRAMALFTQTGQSGSPRLRLSEVKAALSRGNLPAQRGPSENNGAEDSWKFEFTCTRSCPRAPLRLGWTPSNVSAGGAPTGNL